MTPDQESVWVTVADACQRLNLAPRTGQRYASKLAESDRQVAEGGGPMLVRLSAMQARAKARSTQNDVRPVAKSGEPVAEYGEQLAHIGTPVAESGEHALIAELRASLATALADKTTLTRLLEAEQENTRTALSQLADARREGQMIMGAVAAGRLEIAPADVQNVQNAPHEGAGEQVDQAEKHRPFWESLAFWRR